MITIRPGSHVHTLLTILPFVGEFPMRSLHLLGSERSYKDLIRKLNQPQEFRFPDNNDRITCRMLTVCGKGKRKTIRFYKGALPLLERFDEYAYQYYLDAFDEHNFSGNARHVERNHAVAEVAVMCMKAGIESRPYDLPDVMEDYIRNLQVSNPSFFLSRELKQVNDYELNKIRFTRLIGSIVYHGGCYAVYNTRDEGIKWLDEGESKIKYHLHQIFTPMLGYDFPLRNAAVFFGASFEAAMETLQTMEETYRRNKAMNPTYYNIFFVPQTEFGVRLLRVLTVYNWEERLLQALFAPADRSYNRGNFAYDAYKDGVYYLSFLSGDIWALFQFRNAVMDRPGQFVVICYPEQADAVKQYIGDKAQVQTVAMEQVEKYLGIEKKNLLE